MLGTPVAKGGRGGESAPFNLKSVVRLFEAPGQLAFHRVPARFLAANNTMQ